MAKAKKISKKQLEELREFVNLINQGQAELGSIEMQKHSLLHKISNAQEDFSRFQTELQEEYGMVSISIEDGSLKPLEEKNNETNS